MEYISGSGLIKLGYSCGYLKRLQSNMAGRLNLESTSGASTAVVPGLEGVSESSGVFVKYSLQATPPECLMQ